MPNVVIVGAQWGDEGKGKIVDILSEDADIITRYQGGNNAGHTVIIGEDKFILHILPTGILHAGKKCVIGNGVVVDPGVLISELDGLLQRGHFNDPSSLLISDRAHLILPYHKKLDLGSEKLKGKGMIGTTGKGIGPAYEDKYARTGILCGDLLKEDVFKEKLTTSLAEKNFYLESIMGVKGFELDEIFDEYMAYGQKLKRHITNTTLFLNNAIKECKNILFEGAQGTLLDIDHGTYPYVTSSNASAGGVCSGTGVGPTYIDKVIGVSKAYTTRVGEGPFPTELKEDFGEKLRKQGGELGATTGRPRRCGWLDIVMLRYSVMINGMSGIILTKLDILDNFDKIPICIGYEYEGEKIQDFPHDPDVLEHCTPYYEEMDGWKEKTSHCQSFEQLPKNAQKYIRRIEELIEAEIVMLSLGAKRKEAITLKNPFH
ncbi:MAG: adenylosuccinate synthase [Thermodesulfobacteriota bacterium]